jgi:preprotein translocase SecE subunit
MKLKNNSIVKYIVSSYQELKKVSWPTGKTILNHTLIVVISSAIAIAITSAVDYGLTSLVEYFIENRG